MRDADLARLVDVLPDVVVVVGADGAVDWANARVTEVLGWSADDLSDRKLVELVHTDDLDVAVRAVTPAAGGLVAEVRLADAAGGHRPMEWWSHPFGDGRVLVTLRDHTGRRAKEARPGGDDVTRIPVEPSSLDPLTGVGDAAAAADHLARALAGDDAEGVLVLVVDVDRFTHLHELYGKEAADTVLQEVAARLRDAVRPGDLVARLQGDDFLVIATTIPNPDVAAAVAARIERTVSGPVPLGRFRLPLEVSVGHALGAPGCSAGELMAQASSAVDAVKASKGAMAAAAFVPKSARWVASELPRALEHHELVVHYQPVVALPEQRVVGYEALVRWAHPERGLVEPGEFLPVAEAIGLAPAVGEQVVEIATTTVARWNRGLPTPYWVSVNLSAAQFHDAGLCSLLERHLGRLSLDSSLLWLEVSEMVALEQGETSTQSLRRLGVRFMVDDFGTGQASVLHLRRLPAGALKIDRSFVSGLGDDADSAAVRAMIELGAALGIDVIAEGVETPQQLDVLAALGCPLAQGFLFGEPGPDPLAGLW